MNQAGTRTFGPPIADFAGKPAVVVPERSRTDPNIQLIGSFQQGGFFLDVKELDANSVVYSLGVGDNIEWDLSMIRLIGCKVYAFDPDPLSIEWLSKQSVPAGLVFTPVGAGDHDGEIVFYQPPREGKINKSSILKTAQASSLPVKRLQTLMKERGHVHIDVLKVNIEGGEYAIISDIVNVPIKQLIIEFHDRFVPRIGWLKTKIAEFRLRRAGFKLIAREGEIRTYSKIS